ncbi:MAG: hypothetical protein WC746_00475 [archaeon]|jgi:hypothetical protein
MVSLRPPLLKIKKPIDGLKASSRRSASSPNPNEGIIFQLAANAGSRKLQRAIIRTEKALEKHYPEFSTVNGRQVRNLPSNAKIKLTNRLARLKSIK